MLLAAGLLLLWFLIARSRLGTDAQGVHLTHPYDPTGGAAQTGLGSVVPIVGTLQKFLAPTGAGAATAATYGVGGASIAGADLGAATGDAVAVTAAPEAAPTAVSGIDAATGAGITPLLAGALLVGAIPFLFRPGSGTPYIGPCGATAPMQVAIQQRLTQAGYDPCGALYSLAYEAGAGFQRGGVIDPATLAAFNAVFPEYAGYYTSAGYTAPLFIPHEVSG